MSGRIAGRVAFITGAARGQGRAHAIALAREGADVVCLDVPNNLETLPYSPGTAEDLKETVAAVEALDRRAIAVHGDVRRQEDLDAAVERAISELGRLDIVVANAGIWGLTPAWEITEQQWVEMVDVVLSGPWRTVKAAAPHLLAQGSGSVILTSSVNGLEAGPNVGPPYIGRPAWMHFSERARTHGRRLGVKGSPCRRAASRASATAPIARAMPATAVSGPPPDSATTSRGRSGEDPSRCLLGTIRRASDPMRSPDVTPCFRSPFRPAGVDARSAHRRSLRARGRRAAGTRPGRRRRRRRGGRSRRGAGSGGHAVAG
jgi:NAD(P)-dependent dehydrogenase (short-subunit alcohol dehydrogenase family)